jgi:hypothetical protein
VLDLLGLLYCPQHPSSLTLLSPQVTPSRPQRIAYPITDRDTKLPWLFLGTWDSRSEIWLTPLLPRRRYRISASCELGRAFSTFEPEKLLQIRVWCSQGICSIRFQGTEAMGIITVGDWPADAEGVYLSSDKKMLIDGTFHLQFV